MAYSNLRTGESAEPQPPHIAAVQYVEREERRETFRQETIKAWEEYQEIGLQATAVDVDAWLASWGTVNELPVPACHK
jgi:predicted transcriptional regulator